MRFVYLIIGFISFGLGAIGVILPVLPTTPFLLLASFCFAKGSTKFHTWFTNTKIYKNNLDSFVKKRAMTLKTKVIILTSASLMLLIPLFMMKNIYGRAFIVFLYLVKYYYFIFKIKTIKPSEGVISK